MKLRLDKYLSEIGLGTRSEVKKAIQKGLVQVNTQFVQKPEYKVDTEKDQVMFSGKLAVYVEYEYYMLNKPAGVISASTDSRERCVVDLILSRRRKDLFPVGRLDKDTEGLLLITNDGGLAHRLLSPKKHVDKVYYARIQGRVTQEDVAAFRQGVDIGEEKRTLPAGLLILTSKEVSEVELTIQEGKFHQVKRMLAAREKPVLYLERIRMGGLPLDPELSRGAFRFLTEEEIEELRALV